MASSTRGHAEVIFEGRVYIAYSDCYDDARELERDCVRHIEEFKAGKRTPPNGFNICDPYYSSVVDLEKRKFVVSGRIPEDTAPFLKTFIAARRNRCDILFVSGARVDSLGISLDRKQATVEQAPVENAPKASGEETVPKMFLNILRSARSSKLGFLRLATMCAIPFLGYHYGTMRGVLPLFFGILMLTMIGSFSGDTDSGRITLAKAEKRPAKTS